MRIVAFIVASLALAATARADPSEQAMKQEADAARSNRHRTGAVLLVVGALAVGAGIAFASVETEDSIDLAPVIKLFGYGFIAAGGLNLVAGTVTLTLHESPAETRYRSRRVAPAIVPIHGGAALSLGGSF